jgi:hypothetical protein
MEIRSEVWEVLAKFFLTISNGFVLGGFFAYVFQDKNLIVGLLVLILGVIHLLLGLYITNIAAFVKRKEK